MKKWFAGVLCVLLIFSASLAGAESAPWLSPWFSFAENAMSGDMPMYAKVSFPIDGEAADRLAKTNDDQSAAYFSMLMENEVSEDIRVLYKSILETNKQQFRANMVMLANTTVELWADNGRYAAKVMVGDYLLADADVRTEQTTEGIKYFLTTNLLPSFVFTLTKATEEKQTPKTAPAIYARLLACAKAGDGLAIVRGGIEFDRQQAEYFLNGADSVTLTSEEYETLLQGAPLPTADSVFEAVTELVLEAIDGLDMSAVYFFPVEEGAAYTFERTPDGYVARMTYTEKDADFQEKDGGQGYEKVEKEYQTVSTVTIGQDTIVYDDVGHMEMDRNRRLTMDVSQPDLARGTYASETSSSWFNVSRDGNGQYATLGLDQADMVVKGEASVDNAGNAAEVLLSVSGAEVLSIKAGRSEDGMSAAPELTGRKEIALVSDDGKNYGVSDADMALVKDELYNVTRPRMIDFALSKLPKGTESLTALLMSISMMIGR